MPSAARGVMPSDARGVTPSATGGKAVKDKCCRGEIKEVKTITPATLHINIMIFTVARIMNSRW